MSSKTNLILEDQPAATNAKYVLVIHGGAGTMSKAGSTPEKIASYRAALAQALMAGYEILSNGGTSLDATVAAVSSMEDCPLFNSAHGAVFNVDGKNELEASVMCSKPPESHPDVPAHRRGMALTLLTRSRNPSRLVRALYLSPSIAPHPFLSGQTAEHLGESLGEQLVDPAYFYTESRWREHRRGLGLPEEPLPPGKGRQPTVDPVPLDMLPRGTVGAVALDMYGCITAVTSTGGRTNKLVGRIGDTPVMGAGFWAEQWRSKGRLRRTWLKLRRKPSYEAVGISGTGDGDYFLRQSAASSIAGYMKSANLTLKKASERVVNDLLRDGGLGGVIALDSRGNVAMPLNCSGMYRGVINENGVPKTAIFREDILS